MLAQDPQVARPRHRIGGRLRDFILVSGFAGTVALSVGLGHQPLQVFIREADQVEAESVFLEAGQRIFFTARVAAGLSRYETTWNFGTGGADKVDATGDRVTYTFDKEGNYTITCHVHDLNDGKDPVTSAFEVRVSRAR